MLSEEQLERRTRSVGASEVGAIVGCEMPGGKTMVDVFLTKRRGPELQLEPYLPPEPEPDTCDAWSPFLKGDPRTAGSILEAGIAELYAYMTGAELELSDTEVHPDYPWASATPDRYVLLDGAKERGLEIKLVGARMADRWPGEGLPDYVRCQAQWSMHVTDLERWDVCALVGGSEPRILRLERDDELITGMHDVVEAFWHDYVLADRMPPAVTGDDAIRALRAKWAEDNGEVVVAPKEAALVVAQYAEAKAALKEAEQREAKLKAALCALTGENRGITGPWGRFLFYSRRGNVAWKEVALELAGGAIPDSVLEQHRGASTRIPKFTPKKTK